jgi:outer membrane protein assembly factor BamD (BamD/ComL family)
MRRSIGLTLAFLLWGTSLLWAGDGVLLLTETVQLRVAEVFLEEREFYRAVTEFKRFLILFPESEKEDYVRLQMGLAYHRGGDYDGAARQFHRLAEQFPSSTLVSQARYLEGLAVWKGTHREQAQDLFEALAEADPAPPYGPRALAAAALVCLERDDPQVARKALQRFLTRYPDQVWVPQVQGAFDLLAGYEELPQKSEVLAGILSGILPGAGYAYAGDYATGFMSLLVNGAFIAGTWTAFAQGLDALGVLAGGIGAPFYIGNIYGSALAARKWNQQTLRQAREPIYSALGFVFE